MDRRPVDPDAAGERSAAPGQRSQPRPAPSRRADDERRRPNVAPPRPDAGPARQPRPVAGQPTDASFGQITGAEDWAQQGWTEDGWDADWQDTDWGDTSFDDEYPDEWDDPYGDYAGGGRRFVGFLVAAVVIIGVIVGGVALFRDDVENFLNGGATDYAGTGNGQEVLVVIAEGDTGADVSRTLVDEGVTASFDAMYNLLLDDGDAGFQPGTYALQGEMSAASARDALLDPANKVADRLLIREGTFAEDALALAAEFSGLPLSDFQAAAQDLAALGIPPEAPSIEGYLFPATYEVQPGQSAQQIVQMMVDEMFERLDAADVAPEDRHRVLTMASIIQREAGSVEEDFYKVSRVFYNRLETEGWRLQSDATVSYGTSRTDSVFTTDDERADAGNPYNTYANDGLPIGPIGLPGELAVDAASHPADGPWFYFVPINLETGETVFSETLDQHNVAVAELQAWCNANETNSAYCQ